MNKVKVARNAMIAATTMGIGGAALAYSRLKDSTKDYIRMVGWHRLDLWPHGLFYLGKTYDYIGAGRLGIPFLHLVPQQIRDWVGGNYHGKLVPLEEAQKLVSVEEDIEALDLEHIIPYETCRDIILKHGDAIAVGKCYCRHTSPNHCYPDEVCMGIGEPMATFVLEHQPEIWRRITVEEALDILEETDKAGCMHAAFFKDVIGGKFYALCNCCKCCCIAVEGQRYKGIPFFGHSGLMPKFDAEKCTSCGICEEACVFDCITVEKKSIPKVDLDVCMGCGVCRAKCPSDAVTLVKAPDRPEPLLVDELPRKKKSA